VAVPALAADGDDETAQVVADAPTTSASTTTTPSTTTTLSPETQAAAEFAKASPEQQQFIIWMSLSEEERNFIRFVSATDEQRSYIAFISAPEEQRAAFVNAFAPPPAPRSQPAPQQSSATVTGDGSVWDSLAQCEASGNWSTNTGNGYSGGLQFAHSSWRGFGGGEFAPMAYQATREQQIVVAERILASQGWGAWPACARKLGLR
jgi:hypothetical protein